MSEFIAPAEADAPAPARFTMIVGDASAMVCEGDVCYIPDLPVA